MWARTHREEVKDGVGVLVPLRDIALPGPHVPLGHLALHVLAAGRRAGLQAQQEGDAPQRLHLGDDGVVQRVHEAREVHGVVAGGGKRRRDEAAVVQAGPVEDLAPTGLVRLLEGAQAEGGVAERREELVDVVLGGALEVAPTGLLVGGGGPREAELVLEVLAEDLVGLVEAGAEDDVVGLEAAAVLEGNLVGVAQQLDLRPVDSEVAVVEDLPEVRHTGGSKAGVGPEHPVMVHRQWEVCRVLSWH